MTVTGNVLCIEDEFAVGDLFRKMLSRMGYKAILAVNGKIGIEMAHAHQVDLVMLDLNLPGMSGFDVLKELRAISHMQEIPVIAVTALSMYEECMEAGFDGYLNKPILPGQLQDVLEQFLET